MSDISLRIKELIVYKKLNNSSFEKKIGVGNNSIGTIITKKTNVSGAILSKILNNFEDISAEWLVIGKGNMVKNETLYKDYETLEQKNNIFLESEPTYNLEKESKIIEILEKFVQELQKDKKELLEDKCFMQRMLENSESFRKNTG
jgi:hypothetical protein